MRALVLSKSEALLRRIAELHSPSPILPARFWNNAHVLEMDSDELRNAVSLGKNGEPIGVGPQIWGVLKRARAQMGIQGREPDPAARLDKNPKKWFHAGNDFFVRPGKPVKAPFNGVVYLSMRYKVEGRLSNLIILKHVLSVDGKKVTFFTVYDHLSNDSLVLSPKNKRIRKGARFAYVGGRRENGGVQPHVHFQIHCTDRAEEVSQYDNLKGSFSEEQVANLVEDVHNTHPDPCNLYPRAPWHAPVSKISVWPPPHPTQRE